MFARSPAFVADVDCRTDLGRFLAVRKFDFVTKVTIESNNTREHDISVLGKVVWVVALMDCASVSRPGRSETEDLFEAGNLTEGLVFEMRVLTLRKSPVINIRSLLFDSLFNSFHKPISQQIEAVIGLV